MMKLVLQQHKNGCGVACAAMVAGIVYAEAHAFFSVGREKSFDEPYTGLTHYDLFSFFNARGFVYQHHFSYKAAVWPPKPFAHAHIFGVQSVNGSHYLCIDRVGRILCPTMGEIPSLAPVYYAVQDCIGIWPKPPKDI